MSRPARLDMAGIRRARQRPRAHAGGASNVVRLLPAPYRVQFLAAHPQVSFTVAPWYGEPTPEALEAALRRYNESTAPGGANAYHTNAKGIRPLARAGYVISQETNEVVAEVELADVPAVAFTDLR